MITKCKRKTPTRILSCRFFEPHKKPKLVHFMQITLHEKKRYVQNFNYVHSAITSAGFTDTPKIKTRNTHQVHNFLCVKEFCFMLGQRVSTDSDSGVQIGTVFTNGLSTKCKVSSAKLICLVGLLGIEC
jgi:hypothetical protein